MGGYLAYPEYKDSGVEWLGKIPSHWEVVRFSHFIAFQEGPGIMAADFRDEGVPLLRIVNLKPGYVDLDGCNYLSPEKVEKTWKHFRLKPNDLLISCSASTGLISIVDEVSAGAIAYTGIIRLNPARREIDRGFIKILVSSELFFTQIDLLKTGSTIQHYGPVHLRQIKITLPPLPEQQSIARFLDSKTAQIDALIAKKETLLAKLAEKRTALISQAVTKGLDPTVPLKPSGIEWLGDIPAHWDTPPLYARYSLELGKMLHKGRITGDYLVRYLRNVDVQWDFINQSDLPEMDIRPGEYKRYLVQPGDILICEGGEVGRTAIVPEIEYDLAFQKALHRLRALTHEESSRFFFYTMSWAANLGVFLAGGNPNTIPHLTGEKLRLYRFPTPPLEEQNTIANFLDQQTAQVNQQTAQIKAAISKLKEYRTALITNAVTGKIDVRDVKLPELGSLEVA